RAAIHPLGQKKRIVLGDWKEDSAEILEIQENQDFESLKLKKWRY
ncbi:MAG: UDP-2,3-diacylglucosamine diphosphatase, partial [Acinetobacter pseudolwoffii]